jgi:hypothetical protein
MLLTAYLLAKVRPLPISFLPEGASEDDRLRAPLAA